MLLDHPRDGLHDPEERQRAAAERLDALLVGGIEHRRGRARELSDVSGQVHRGERLVVEREELPGRGLAPVEGGRGVGDAFGPAEADGDGPAHVGGRGVGQCRSVRVLNHRVDIRLRVHDHLNAVEGNVVEQVGLDHLQALVDEGRGVDRDHRAHGPGGVGERVLDGDGRQLVPGTTAERPAGRGDDQLAHVGAGAGGQRLEERGVLGVDRDDLARLGERLDQRAADDERLLVGEREGAARLQGGERGRESDGAGDAVEHGVAVGGGKLGGRLRSGEDLGERLARPVLGGERLPQRRYDVLAGDGDGPRPQPVRLLGEEGDPAAVGGQGGDPEAVRVAQHEVDGLGPDRPGGSEDHHVLRAVARHRVVDEVGVREWGWTVAHPPIVSATARREDSASLARVSRARGRDAEPDSRTARPGSPGPGRSSAIRPLRARRRLPAGRPRTPGLRLSRWRGGRSPAARRPVSRPRSTGRRRTGRRRPAPATRTRRQGRP